MITQCGCVLCVTSLRNGGVSWRCARAQRWPDNPRLFVAACNARDQSGAKGSPFTSTEHGSNACQCTGQRDTHQRGWRCARWQPIKRDDSDSAGGTTMQTPWCHVRPECARAERSELFPWLFYARCEQCACAGGTAYGGRCKRWGGARAWWQSSSPLLLSSSSSCCVRARRWA